jgi:hypothetical protein
MRKVTVREDALLTRLVLTREGETGAAAGRLLQ